MAAAVTSPLRVFLHAESAGGIVLVIAAASALVWANSPAADGYAQFWQQKITLGGGPASVTHDLRHWVNDGLMVLFFFVIGLEIKRELVVGKLRDRPAATLPALAAVGGVVLPALIYVTVVGGGDAMRGWGIPMATDIAFTVGILALLGRHASTGAKLLLLSVAIVDDILAIGVIAIVYTDRVNLRWLATAAAGLLRPACAGSESAPRGRMCPRVCWSGSPPWNPACTPPSPASRSACSPPPGPWPAATSSRTWRAPCTRSARSW
jgi:NhaA family Na+:H+ antiporter